MQLPSNDYIPELVRALWDRDFAAAHRLIEAGASLDDILEEDGGSMLHQAAQDGDVGMVDFFLAHPCPKTLRTFDYIDHTPLIRAAAHGQGDVVRRLIAAGSDVNARNEERAGNTAIREAVRGGHAEVVKRLLDAGADPTIPGWMMISAVDQAHHSMEGGADSPNGREILRLLSKFPRASQHEKK
jgi:ankyrin repeat protein